MADSVADSTKSEDSENNTESTERVSTSTEGPAGAADPPHRNGASVIQPSKLGGFRPGFSAFGGSGANTGAFSTNPFAPRATLKSDVVSTGSAHPHPHEGTGLIAPSRFMHNPFMPHDKSASQSDNDSDVDVPGENRKFQLRPSALTNQVETLKSKGRTSPQPAVQSSILKPATLPDPRQSQDNKEGHREENEDEACEDKEVSSTSLPVKSPDKPQAAKQITDNGLFSAAAAVAPENSVADSTSKSAAGAEGGEFIFGQNLTERVTGVSSSQAASESASGFVFGQNLADRVVHSDAGSPPPDTETNGKEAESCPSDSGGQTLEESAREYQAKHGVKPDLKEVEIVTGEEDESNVLQANCKLFLFDGEKQNWNERGRGVLKLNDMSPSNPAEQFHSRLIMRTQGSLRLILNTKIWSGMMVERASSKSLRITATDGDDGVKVFLVTAAPKDSENILRAIDWRVQRLKMWEEKERSRGDDRVSEKRKADSTDAQDSPLKRQKKPTAPHQAEGGAPTNLRREESDSSVQDPETEASCESFSSSFTVRSESD
ncbi:ran-binding protein 3-like isoform X1 [Haliotis asinina]|uniref:ran-binding protein 3-like isoform X1 n=1 Tax=Haliotis asinina TaxID=109174 RepID=UPI003532245D